jgi:hypothetical protein
MLRCSYRRRPFDFSTSSEVEKSKCRGEVVDAYDLAIVEVPISTPLDLNARPLDSARGWFPRFHVLAFRLGHEIIFNGMIQYKFTPSSTT